MSAHWAMRTVDAGPSFWGSVQAFSSVERFAPDCAGLVKSAGSSLPHGRTRISDRIRASWAISELGGCVVQRGFCIFFVLAGVAFAQSERGNITGSVWIRAALRYRPRP